MSETFTKMYQDEPNLLELGQKYYEIWTQNVRNLAEYIDNCFCNENLPIKFVKNIKTQIFMSEFSGKSRPLPGNYAKCVPERERGERGSDNTVLARCDLRAELLRKNTNSGTKCLLPPPWCARQVLRARIQKSHDVQHLGILLHARL
jgi:hypothetical protein